jgi:hypothetical protein
VASFRVLAHLGWVSYKVECGRVHIYRYGSYRVQHFACNILYVLTCNINVYGHVFPGYRLQVNDF